MRAEHIVNLGYALADESTTLGSGERLRMDRIFSLDGRLRPT